MELVVFLFLISMLITVSKSLTIIRGGVDEIRNVNERMCTQFKGEYMNGTCTCSDVLPTFMSLLHQQPFCVNHNYLGCVEVTYDNPIITPVEACSNETIESIFVWNSVTYEENVVFGEWIKVTSKALSHFAQRIDSRKFRLSINVDKRSAQLVKVTLKCDSKCYFLKMVGTVTYPLKPELYGVIQTKQGASEGDNGLRVGIIVLVVGVMSFIAAIFFTTIHAYRNNLLKCFRRKDNNTSLVMDEVTMPLDTQISVVTPANVIKIARLDNPRGNVVNFYGGATSSEFTSLERLDNSQYSAISPSYSEASIKRGMENSSWENTPSQQRATATAERSRAGNIYQELLTLPPDRFTVSPRCTRSETHF